MRNGRGVGHGEYVVVKQSRHPCKHPRIPPERDAQALDDIMEDDFDNKEAL